MVDFKIQKIVIQRVQEATFQVFFFLDSMSIYFASTTSTCTLVYQNSRWQPHRRCTRKNMKVAKCSPSQEGLWCFVYMREHLSVWMIYFKRESEKSFWKHTHPAPPPMWTEGSIFTWPNGSDGDGIEEKRSAARLQGLLWSPPPLSLRSGTHQKGDW